MGRKYVRKSPKIKVGDFVYIYYDGLISKAKYKVIDTPSDSFCLYIVEVTEETRKLDDYITGWKPNNDDLKTLETGKLYWYVKVVYKYCSLILNNE